MIKLKNFLKYYRAMDLVIISFALFLTLLNIIYYTRVNEWAALIFINFIVILLVTLIAYFNRNKNSVIWMQLHNWYIVPLIFLSFKEVYLMVKPIRINDLDPILIEADRFLFGTDPTVVLHAIANPFLTEILQITYGTFFFLPIILGIDLMLNDRFKDFRFETYIVVFGFFLSYAGYFLVPAIGPRFTLHEFAAINTELPGLYLTNFLREIVNSGESIPSGTLNPAMVVQRDCFPSGHTQMTLIVMYLSIKLKTCTRFIFIPVGILLIFSTVYLRYHYVVDVIAGAVFMIVTMWLGKLLFNKWLIFKGEEKFEYPN